MSDWQENLHTIPEHMRDGVERYVLQGIPPGGFLEAVLSNNLKNAILKADHINIRFIKEWVEYMVWSMPHLAQGSPEKVAAWIMSGGLNGILEKQKDAAST